VTHWGETARRRLKRVLVAVWVVTAVLVLGSALVVAVMGERLHVKVADQDPWVVLAAAAALSFAAEYVDGSVGMGYGTTLTPLLLLLGFSPHVVVPAILVQQLIAGAIAAFSHHSMGNVDLRPGSPALKLGLLLGGCGVVGGALTAGIAMRLPAETLQAITGVIVIAMGLVLTVAGRFKQRFSWWRAGALGLIAAGNKGLMGGGYGPLITGGQVLAGMGGAQAVAITCLSEVMTCAGGLVSYGLSGAHVTGHLAVGLIVGGTLAAVPAAATVRALPKERLTAGISVACLVLGLLSVLRAVL
jgi:uncharacterized protein